MFFFVFKEDLDIAVLKQNFEYHLVTICLFSVYSDVWLCFILKKNNPSERLAYYPLRTNLARLTFIPPRCFCVDIEEQDLLLAPTEHLDW